MGVTNWIPNQLSLPSIATPTSTPTPLPTNHNHNVLKCGVVQRIYSSKSEQLNFAKLAVSKKIVTIKR
jgi:hypothetical protein